VGSASGSRCMHNQGVGGLDLHQIIVP